MSREIQASKSQASAALAESRGSASPLLPDSRYEKRSARRLIVNADDFGVSEQVNEAIIRAFNEGVLTSASLMVTGAAFEQAVMLAKENPGLSIGIHVVTVVGRSVLPHSEIPSLVDPRGNFSNNPTAAGLKYYFSPQARRELKRELAAQFERFHSTGLPLSHIDGHLHLHVHPVIFNIALELGAKYGVRRMRVPVEERRLALQFDRRDVTRKTIHAMLFGGLGVYMKKKLSARDFTFPERVYGNLQSGRMSEQYFLYVLDTLSADTSEIYFHPASFQDDKLLNPEERQCSIEFEALMSGLVRRRIDELGVVLTTYSEIEHEQESGRSEYRL
jgi:hopanoid biosynthesis associated protein HpnK